MKTFKDSQGREWTIEVNVVVAKRVRSLLSVDLFKVVEDRKLLSGLSDPIFLVDILYVICKPQADSRGVSDEDFGKAMTGDALEQGAMGLVEELIAFCPSPGGRKNLGRIWTMAKDAAVKAESDAARKIETEVPAVIAASLANAGNSSTPAPASSASTPDP